MNAAVVNSAVTTMWQRLKAMGESLSGSGSSLLGAGLDSDTEYLDNATGGATDEKKDLNANDTGDTQDEEEDEKEDDEEEGVKRDVAAVEDSTYSMNTERETTAGSSIDSIVKELSMEDKKDETDDEKERTGDVSGSEDKTKGENVKVTTEKVNFKRSAWVLALARSRERRDSTVSSSSSLGLTDSPVKTGTSTPSKLGSPAKSSSPSHSGSSPAKSHIKFLRAAGKARKQSLAFSAFW